MQRQLINGEDLVKFWKGMSSLIVRLKFSSKVRFYSWSTHVHTLVQLMKLVKQRRKFRRPFWSTLIAMANFTQKILLCFGQLKKSSWVISPEDRLFCFSLDCPISVLKWKQFFRQSFGYCCAMALTFDFFALSYFLGFLQFQWRRRQSAILSSIKKQQMLLRKLLQIATGLNSL